MMVMSTMIGDDNVDKDNINKPITTSITTIIMLSIIRARIDNLVNRLHRPGKDGR